MLVLSWSLSVGASTAILQHSPSGPLSDKTGGRCVHHKRSGLIRLQAAGSGGKEGERRKGREREGEREGIGGCVTGVT